MDPLSLTASIITAIGVAERLSAICSKIRNNNSLKEFLALANEISDLTLVFKDLQRCFIETRDRPRLSSDQLQTFSNLINDASKSLLELDQFASNQHMKLGPWLDRPAYRSGKTPRSDLVRLRERLSLARLNMVTHMGVLNSWV